MSEKYFQEQLSKAEDVYKEVSSRFRNYVYKQFRSRHIPYKQSPELDAMIDSVVKFRLGLAEDYIRASDLSMRQILEDLCFGMFPAELKNSLNIFLGSCRNNGLDVSFIKGIKLNCINNYNQKYDYL